MLNYCLKKENHDQQCSKKGTDKTYENWSKLTLKIQTLIYNFILNFEQILPSVLEMVEFKVNVFGWWGNLSISQKNPHFVSYTAKYYLHLKKQA